MQLHAALQTIVKHSCDARSLGRFARLALDQRGENQHIAFRLQKTTRPRMHVALPPCVRHVVLHGLTHALDDFDDVLASAIGVGVGQKAAFLRQGVQLPLNVERLRQELFDLSHRQPLRHRDRVAHRLTTLHLSQDPCQRGVRGKGVFAGLQTVLLAAQARCPNEQTCAVDDSPLL